MADEVRFYHLQRQSVTEALPLLVARAYGTGHKLVIRCGSQESAKALSDALWSRDPANFLPHGFGPDTEADKHPIWITDKDSNPSGATISLLLDGKREQTLEGLNRVLVMFDGRDDQNVTEARAYWAALKKQDRKLSYWQQDEHGKWEQKA